ncbi:MAG: Hsp70 family protein [Clostridia bacterium]|nr:Hsp70 family protein [Clostridia bacterium]
MYLGIDFGTCFSSIAGLGDGNKALPNTHIFEKHVKGIPSLFMYSKEKDKNLFGDDCLKGEAKLHSADIVRYMKKLIRRNADHPQVTSGGKTFDVFDIVKAYLHYLITTAQQKAVDSHEFRKPEIEGITVTTPNGIAGGHTTATDYNNWLRKTIMDIAGLPLKNISVLPEPLAAAIYYLYGEDVRKKYTEKQTVLVFDLGGGTLDVTIVEHDQSAAKQYNVKAETGDLTLGGNDWDTALANHILQQKGIREEDFSAEEKARFYEDVTRLKEELSEMDSFEIPLRCGGTYSSAVCTREEFDRVTVGLLNRAIEITKKAIRIYQTNNAYTKLDKIVLVGGASNMPQIKERMIAEFGHTVGTDHIIRHEPSKAIAKGAAIYTKHFSNRRTSTIFSAPKLKINEIATRTYGFNAIHPHDKRHMIYNMLYKGTSFDKQNKICVRSPFPFVALDPHADSITFTVYESEAMKGSSGNENENWMEYGANEVPNGMNVRVTIPEKYHDRADTYECFPEFSLDKNGILEISVYDIGGHQLACDRKKV